MNITQGRPEHAVNRYTADAALGTEHGVLVRTLARLQGRLDDMLNEQRHQVQALEAEIVRLRGQLLQARTQVLWGLGTVAAQTRSLNALQPRSKPVGAVADAASRVLCQVACVGHSHHWLQTDGGCARTGALCDTTELPIHVGAQSSSQ